MVQGDVRMAEAKRTGAGERAGLWLTLLLAMLVLLNYVDRGAVGIRIDSAALLVKDPALADFDPLF